MKWIDELEEMGPCSVAVGWAKESGCRTLAEAWNKCPRANWMLWRIGREKNVDRKRLVLCTFEIAQLMMAVAVETVEAWTCGEASLADVLKATMAAAKTAEAAADVVNATKPAYGARHAANVAYDASNNEDTQRKCADIVRKHFSMKDIIK